MTNLYETWFLPPCVASLRLQAMWLSGLLSPLRVPILLVSLFGVVLLLTWALTHYCGHDGGV